MKHTVVRWDSFDLIVFKLQSEALLVLDTETTGLRPFHGDRLFSIIIGAPRLEEIFYFNFQEYEDLPEDFLLDKNHFKDMVDFLFTQDRDRTWILHNAKFDYHMLRQGVDDVRGKLSGLIHCTMTLHRLADSEAFPNHFALDYLGMLAGYPKDQTVKAYIKKHGLYTKWTNPETGEEELLPAYWRVPFSLIVPYGCRDVEATWGVYQKQMEALEAIEKEVPPHLPRIGRLIDEERFLLRTVAEMEELGVRVDEAFCRRAAGWAEERMTKAMGDFSLHTGAVYVDSNKVFQDVFESDKERWVWGAPSEKKGIRSPKFDSEVLETFQNPAARSVLEYREAKNEFDFYRGFLSAMDKDGIIHTNLNQHGAGTGRFSSSEPNLQNMKKAEDEELEKEFVVRRAIIPREGNVFHMIDFRQVEYRVCMDYAAGLSTDEWGVKKLKAQVNAGADVHQATADLSGTSRQQAKGTNFSIIYGSGLDLLAKNLKVTKERAAEIKEAILSAAPEIRWLTQKASDRARVAGYIVTWCGRRTKISDPRFAYRATNYLIQGGCADIMKIAMNRIRNELLNYKTKMILVVHDEVILEGPPSEAAVVVPLVTRIMEEVFPAQYCPLKVDIEHSFKSMADKSDGIAT